MTTFAGICCEIRPLRPRDKGALRRFFLSHDPDTIRQRYGGAIASLDDNALSRLTNGPDKSTYAYGVFETGAKPATLHAVGRLCFDESMESAEVAFVVGEKKRGQGMATNLLRSLTQEAIQRGLKRLTAEVDPQNHPMLHVLAANGFAPTIDKRVSGLSLSRDLTGRA